MATTKSGQKKPGGKKPGGTIEGKAEEVARKKPRTNPLEFAQQVRNEAVKVTWTSRNETLISSIMVLIMVAIMSIFFFFVDWMLRTGVCTILPINCAS